MSEVKRYDFEQYPHESYMIEADDGQYVDHIDYAELKAQRDALAAENAALREFMLEHCVVECDDGYGIIELPAEGFFPRTINTDAYLNSVRAEGVEMAVSELKDLAQRSESEAPIAAEHNHGAALYLMLFANQLRAGEPS